MPKDSSGYELDQPEEWSKVDKEMEEKADISDRVFVWERSPRGGMAVVYQPALYFEGLPTTLKGENMPEGTFVLIHQVRDDEQEWGLFRFCETYPCPAVRSDKIGKYNVDQVVQTQKDIDETQARERVARHLDRTASSGGNGGSPTAHNHQEDERPTPDQCRHDPERIGGNGVEAQGSEIRSTGAGETQDSVASDNRNIEVKGFGCPHCGYRHPPDGMCLK